MQRMNLILYGCAASQKLAKDLIENLMEVKQEYSDPQSGEIQLILSKTIKETSLIPLLRQSGIHGFRLVGINDQKFSRKGSPLSL